jgi:membrane fusion protein (multidrug efflux system)
MRFRRGFIRFMYLAALVSLLIWITSSVIGGYLYKSADGLVVGDAGVVSPEYTVTVLELLVRNGDRVKKGDLVARVSSTRVAEITATLSLQSSTLVSRMAEITSKAGMIDQLVAGAEARDRTVDANATQLREIRDRNLLPLLTDNAVAEQLFKGKQELAVLRAEKQTMAAQVAQIIAASRFTDQALVDIQTLFDVGRMRAPMNGYVAGVEAGVGSVVQPGGIVAELVGEQRYVLAYVPISRLYTLQAGAPVTIEIGFGKWFHGHISRVEPIAARLPKEFQRTLSPVERQQLVRVDFDPDQELPPFFSKVTVR